MMNNLATKIFSLLAWYKPATKVRNVVSRIHYACFNCNVKKLNFFQVVEFSTGTITANIIKRTNFSTTTFSKSLLAKRKKETTFA